MMGILSNLLFGSAENQINLFLLGEFVFFDTKNSIDEVVYKKAKIYCIKSMEQNGNIIVVESNDKKSKKLFKITNDFVFCAAAQEGVKSIQWYSDNVLYGLIIDTIDKEMTDEIIKAFLKDLLKRIYMVINKKECNNDYEISLLESAMRDEFVKRLKKSVLINDDTITTVDKPSDDLLFNTIIPKSGCPADGTLSEQEASLMIYHSNAFVPGSLCLIFDSRSFKISSNSLISFYRKEADSGIVEMVIADSNIKKFSKLQMSTSQFYQFEITPPRFLFFVKKDLIIDILPKQVAFEDIDSILCAFCIDDSFLLKPLYSAYMNVLMEISDSQSIEINSVQQQQQQQAGVTSWSIGDDYISPTENKMATYIDSDNDSNDDDDDDDDENSFVSRYKRKQKSSCKRSTGLSDYTISSPAITDLGSNRNILYDPLQHNAYLQKDSGFAIYRVNENSNELKFIDAITKITDKNNMDFQIHDMTVHDDGRKLFITSNEGVLMDRDIETGKAIPWKLGEKLYVKEIKDATKGANSSMFVTCGKNVISKLDSRTRDAVMTKDYATKNLTFSNVESTPNSNFSVAGSDGVIRLFRGDSLTRAQTNLCLFKDKVVSTDTLDNEKFVLVTYSSYLLLYQTVILKNTASISLTSAFDKSIRGSLPPPIRLNIIPDQEESSDGPSVFKNGYFTKENNKYYIVAQTNHYVMRWSLEKVLAHKFDYTISNHLQETIIKSTPINEKKMLLATEKSLALTPTDLTGHVVRLSKQKKR